MTVFHTERLVIRHFNEHDAAFIVTLLNENTFIKHIGDKKVRTNEDALNYLEAGPITSYKTFGFGLYLVVIKSSNTPIGMCGLIKRDEFDHPDLGYALLPDYCSKGYAKEAALATLKYVNEKHGVKTVLAITLPSNKNSNKLLLSMGFLLNGTAELYGSDNNLYVYSME